MIIQLYILDFVIIYFNILGVKLTIQDLVLAKNEEPIELNEDALYNVIIQVEQSKDHRPLSLDRFANIWQNFSISPVYFDQFDRFGGSISKRGENGVEDLAFLKVNKMTLK